MTYRTKPCPMCGYRSTVCGLDPEAVERWRNGALIQNAFPDLDADTRELLMTGMHPKCWDAMFKTED